MDDSFLKEIYGGKNSNGKIGMLARGKNIYDSTSGAAHKGGGSQYGRPKKKAIARRLKRM